MAIVMLTAGYELVREMARRYESTVQQQIDSLPSKSIFFQSLASKPLSCPLLSSRPVVPYCVVISVSHRPYCGFFPGTSLVDVPYHIFQSQ